MKSNKIGLKKSVKAVKIGKNDKFTIFLGCVYFYCFVLVLLKMPTFSDF